MSDPEVLPGSDQTQAAPTPQAGAGEGAAPAPARSLHDELKAQFAAAEAAPEPGPKEASPGAAPTATASPEGKSQTPPGDRQRNELGQFVKEEHKAPEPKTQSASGEPGAVDPKAPAGAESQQPRAIAPASWSVAAKAAFAALPDVVQQEVLKRETDWNRGLAQQRQDAEKLNRLNAILSPRTERFRLAGISDTQAIEQLFAAQDYLERDPVGALLYLARGAGVDPRHLAAVFTGQAPSAPQLPVEYQQMMQRVQSLEQGIQQTQQQAEQAQMEQMLNQIHAFASDPQHQYFENVRGTMSALVRSGEAKTLDEAYSKATWANDAIRGQLIADQARAAEEAAKAKAAEARRAAGSITGSPAPGADLNGSGGPARSLRDELRHNFEALS